MLMFENYRKKWGDQKAYYRKYNVKKLPEKKTKSGPNKDDDDPIWDEAKWTNSAGGQQEDGGWNSEGVNRFQQLKLKVKKAKYWKSGKPKKAYVEAEQKFLPILRQKFGIKCDNAELEKKRKRQAKNKNMHLGGPRIDTRDQDELDGFAMNYATDEEEEEEIEDEDEENEAPDGAEEGGDGE